MNLGSLLREFLEEKEKSSPPHTKYNFLPNFNRDNNLPIFIEDTPWSRTDGLEYTIKFQRREDLQDFVNCYLELEEESGTYARLSIDGFQVCVSSDEPLPQRFKSMIEEIAHETRGS